MKILITGGNGNIAQIIKRNLQSDKYQITALSRNDLNILNCNNIKSYLMGNTFDVLIHTAIVGGRRTKEETSEVFYNNMLMFENIMKFSHMFKMIINFDSAAIYDRNTDILNRKESDILTIPTDYYGFSKYVIYNRTLAHNNTYNFRIFNIFHTKEENNRFIKNCFNAKKNNTEITIFEDKYFDFVYEDDFIQIIKFYVDNLNSQQQLLKTINICYESKYKLSEIAMLILGDNDKIKVLDVSLKYNYTGDNTILKSLNLELNGLEKSLLIYENNLK
jgi:nucleoside-diphosphate-sugar epimerase